MDLGMPSAGPVDLPRRRVDLEIGKRRHRRVTGPAGVLLFVCLFLPAMKGCSETIYPVTVPMFWHPYIFGLVFALGTATVSVRNLRYTIVALRVLAWLTIAGGVFLTIASGGVGLAQIGIGGILSAAIGARGHSERRVALTAIAAGSLSLLWFGLWVLTPEALIGVYLSALASVGLVVGGLVWLGELALVRPPPIVVPRAVARERE